jgi:hypothetical protein
MANKQFGAKFASTKKVDERRGIITKKMRTRRKRRKRARQKQKTIK